MTFEVIPTKAVWLANSRASRVFEKRSHKDLKALDSAVGAYEAVMKGKPTVQSQYVALVELLQALEAYLASKSGVHNGHRAEAAAALKAIVLKTLSQIRWQKIKDLTGAQRGGKMLDSSVWSEFHDPKHTRAGPDTRAFAQGLAPDYDTESEERYLFQYLKVYRSAITADSVKYMESEERWRYLVSFDGLGRLYRRDYSSGEVVYKTRALDTRSGTEGMMIYAIDMDGRLYCEGTPSPQLNHCSFLAGMPVMCAGNMGVRNGKLEYIDNGSGHYRPGARNLLKALECLHDEHAVPLGGVLACTHDKVDAPVYDADVFLRHRGVVLKPLGVRGRGDYWLYDKFKNPDETKAWIIKNATRV